MDNLRRNDLNLLLRLALGSTLQGFAIVTIVVLIVTGSFHLLLALLTSHMVQAKAGGFAKFINSLVSGLIFARPVLWTWALVVVSSAAVRRYAPRKHRAKDPENE